MLEADPLLWKSKDSPVMISKIIKYLGNKETNHEYGIILEDSALRISGGVGRNIREEKR